MSVATLPPERMFHRSCRLRNFPPVHGLASEPSSGLFGDMRGVIVEDQLDRRVGRIGGVEKLEE